MNSKFCDDHFMLQRPIELKNIRGIRPLKGRNHMKTAEFRDETSAGATSHRMRSRINFSPCGGACAQQQMAQFCLVNSNSGVRIGSSLPFIL
jgi:hypothetical protein